MRERERYIVRGRERERYNVREGVRERERGTHSNGQCEALVASAWQCAARSR